jgi:putative ABC transport system permease protein
VTPPRLALEFLSWRLGASDREFVLGDLAEEFDDRVQRDGARRARRWYWSQAIRSCLTRQPAAYRYRATTPRARIMSHLLQHTVFSVRLLRRSPSFTAVVILTLALGIGATTAIFSVVHAALLKPLPFKHAQELVVPLNGTDAATANPVSYPQLQEWRESLSPFQELAGYFNSSATLGGTSEPEAVFGMRSTASLFSILGVEPMVGRLFTEAEESRSAEPVVLISEQLWRRRFDAARDIQGRRISLNDVTFTIVGVMPGWFRHIRPTDQPRDFFAPLRLTEQNAPASLNFITPIARLKPGQTAATGQEQLQAAILRANPDAQPQPRVVVIPLRDRLVIDSKSVLLALLGAVGFLLLITCANLANLLLSRGVARRREIAVRLAVGAGQRRIFTQLLTEAVLLAGAGGVAGVLFAWLVIRAAGALPELARAGIYDLSVNWVVLGFAAALSVGAGLLFGLLPALRAGSVSVTNDLRDGSRTTAGRDRVRSAFVVAEVALTLILLTGTGLLGRSLVKLVSVDKGFNETSVLTFGLSTTAAKYPKPSDWTRYFESVVDRLSHIAGVESVSLSSDIPLSGGDTNGGVTIEGRTFEPGQGPMAQKRVVSPEYFSTLGISTRRGRVFRTTDDASAPAVIVISESFARRWFPDEDPIGKHVGFNWDINGFQTVIGVVADVRHNGLDDTNNSAIYVNFRQRPDSAFTVLVKTPGPPEALTAAVRNELKAIDPSRPMTNVRTMSTLLAQSIGGRTLSLNLVGGFAIIGLLLAATGIYGVVSHATQQRSREFGIRLALGAEAGSVLRSVLRQGFILGVTGTVVGLAGALALGSVIRAQLFGIEPSDPLTLVAVSGALVGIALVAGYLPARRATRINPVAVLKDN